METKFCKFCQCEHPLTDEFWYITKKGHHRCRSRINSYEQKRKGTRTSYNAEYRQKNIETISEREKEYNAANRLKKSEYNKQYREDHEDYFRDYNAAKYAEKIIENRKKSLDTYYANKAKRIEYARVYKRARKALDLCFKISCNMRTRLCQAIKSNQKSGSAVKDLGCTIPELRQYLESKFQEGMTWDNWGTHGWHIDHIIPLASFNLADRDQFLKACHYTNLQPLWATENLSKGSKVATEQGNMVK